MPGVYRPYTLVDVLGALNQSQTDNQQGVTGSLSYFGESSETMPTADSVTGTVQTVPTWDNGVWGATSWS
jgi:hypothetical protein